MWKFTSWLWNMLQLLLKPLLRCREVGLPSRRNPEQDSSALPLLLLECSCLYHLGVICIADFWLHTLLQLSLMNTPNVTRLAHSDAAIAPTAKTQHLDLLYKWKAGRGSAEQPDGADGSCQHEVFFNSRVFLNFVCHEYSILSALCIWICFKPDRILTPPPFLWPP